MSNLRNESLESSPLPVPVEGNDPDLEQWLTLHLRAYSLRGCFPHRRVGEGADAAESEKSMENNTQMVIPTIDPDSLYVATLLRAGFPRFSSSAAAHTTTSKAADEKPNLPWIFSLLPHRSASSSNRQQYPELVACRPRRHGSTTSLAAWFSGGSSVSAEGEEEDRLINLPSISRFLLPPTTQHTQQEQQQKALAAYIERELVPLVLHSLYGEEATFQNVTMPAYVESFYQDWLLREQEERLGSGVSPAATADNEKLPLLTRWRLSARARAQARDIREAVRPILVRAGLLSLDSSVTANTEPEPPADPPEAVGMRVGTNESPAYKASFATKGSALDGLQQSTRERHGGVGLMGKGLGAFRTLRVSLNSGP